MDPVSKMLWNMTIIALLLCCISIGFFINELVVALRPSICSRYHRIKRIKRRRDEVGSKKDVCKNNY